MAIQVGSAFGKVVLDASGVKSGVTEAVKSLGGLNTTAAVVGGTISNFGARLRTVDTWLRNNSAIMNNFGNTVQEAGKKMLTFIGLPILGFFGLIIKKALDADTAMSKLAKESTEKLSASLAKLGEKFLPLFIKIVDGLTNIIDKFLELDPATQGFITKAVIGFGLILPAALQLAGWLVQIITFLGGLGTSFGTAGVAAGTAGTAFAGIGASIAGVLLPIILIIGALALLYWAFKTNFMGISDTAKQLWFIIKFYFTEGWKWLVNAVKGGAGIVLDWFKRMTDKIVTAFKNINWGQIGKNMILGLANGLLGGIPSLVMAATRAAEAALNAIKKRLDMRSPSGEFMKLGNLSGQGYQQGLAVAMDPNLIARTMAKPVQNMTNSQHQNINMQFASGLTLRHVQSMLAENNDKLLLQLNNALGGG